MTTKKIPRGRNGGRKSGNPSEKKTQICIYVEWCKVKALGGMNDLTDFLHASIDRVYLEHAQHEPQDETVEDVPTGPRIYPSDLDKIECYTGSGSNPFE